MLKLWGSLMIIFAFYAMGQKIAEARRHRLEFIENMLSSLSDFKTAVELFSLPVPRALEKSGISEYEKMKISKILSEEDEKDFSVFMKGVKSETIEGQLSNILVYERKLRKEETEEREKYKKEAKLIKGGFSLLGLLFTVMLL